MLCSYRRCLLFVSSYCFDLLCWCRPVARFVPLRSSSRRFASFVVFLSSYRRVVNFAVFDSVWGHIVFPLAKHIAFLSYLLLISWDKFGELHPWKTEFVAILARILAMSRVTMNLLI